MLWKDPSSWMAAPAGATRAHRNTAPKRGSRIAPSLPVMRAGHIFTASRGHPMPEPYLTQCFNCLSEFDAHEAIWCSCNPQHPTKVCPFCLGCFCASPEGFRATFWSHAPETLRKEIETLSESRMLLGEMLVRSGITTTTQLLEALNKQKADGRRIGEILVDDGALPAERLEKFLQSQHTVTSIDVGRARVDATMIRKLGVDRCLE